MEEKYLQDLGLNSLESKVYLALLELGEAKTGLICKKLDIPNSHIYQTLNSLIKNGLVNHKLVNKVKVFKPNNPESLKLLFEKKQEKLKQEEKSLLSLIKTLQNKPKNKESESSYQYFEGIKGIKSIFLELNNTMNQNSEAHVFSANEQTWEKLEAFLIEHHKIRVKKNVHERMILPTSAKKLAKTRKKIGKIEIKYLDHKNQAEFGVFGNLVVIQYIGSKVPRGFLIKDELFASTFKNIFDTLWKIAKK